MHDNILIVDERLIFIHPRTHTPNDNVLKQWFITRDGAESSSVLFCYFPILTSILRNSDSVALGSELDKNFRKHLQ